MSVLHPDREKKVHMIKLLNDQKNNICITTLIMYSSQLWSNLREEELF